MMKLILVDTDSDLSRSLRSVQAGPWCSCSQGSLSVDGEKPTQSHKQMYKIDVN